MAFKIAYKICDHGTAGHKEDGYIAQYPFYVVIDGFSEPNNYKNPQKLFDGMTGGEMIVNAVQKVFNNISIEKSLDECLYLVNTEIEKYLKTQGMTLGNAGLIPGASFVFSKIEGKELKIIQGGDCLAVWKYFSGEVNFIPNQAYNHVALNLDTIAILTKKYTEKYCGDRDRARLEMWVEFSPILSVRRQNDINNCLGCSWEDSYAALNGQPEVKVCYQSLSIPTKNLDTVLIFSDGFVDYHQTADPFKIATLAGNLIKDYQKKGGKEEALYDMLLEKRSKAYNKSSYLPGGDDEATAIAMEFDFPQETLENQAVRKEKTLCLLR